MKITTDQKNKIILLRQEGKGVTEIARELDLNIHLVNYWASDDTRKKIIKSQQDYFKKLPLDRKRKSYKARSEYIKKYNYNKYKTDEVFRDKQRARARDYERRKRARLKEEIKV